MRPEPRDGGCAHCDEPSGPGPIPPRPSPRRWLDAEHLNNGMTPHNYITGKVVPITGASSGVGEATARLLSAQGAFVVLAARRMDRLQSLAEELTAYGEALAVATNVTIFDQVRELVNAAVQAYGRVDVMLNNAGLMPHSPLERRQDRRLGPHNGCEHQGRSVRHCRRAA